MRFIDNGRVVLSQILQQCFRSAESVSIAVAFIRKSGLRILREDIDLLMGKGGDMRVLVGKDFGFTEPDALRTLESHGADVRVFVGDRIFHPKCYIFAGPQGTTVISGSSNISSSGLTRGVEWNVKLEESDGDLSQFTRAFEALWASPETVQLSPALLDEMEALCRETVGAVSQRKMAQRMDLSPKTLTFEFTVNASFLRYSPRPLTVPAKHNATIRATVGEPSMEAEIICPKGEVVPGKLHYGVAVWGPFYMIKRIARRSQADPLGRLARGQRLTVEMWLDRRPVRVRLLAR